MFVSASANAIHLISFPTRRSSDLAERVVKKDASSGTDEKIVCFYGYETVKHNNQLHQLTTVTQQTFDILLGFIKDRSEEHTSELQSRFDLVCRLLLEKKK